MAQDITHALQLRDIWLRMGREIVLRGISLDLEMGESLTLLGENGAGKTTLLRLLASAVSPTRGEGRVMGFDINDSRAVRDWVHLMPVDGAFYPDLTCEENLAFSLSMHGADDHVKSRIAEGLARVGLTRAAGRRVRFLSAGMKKRLALTRAHLLARPLTLVDEPFANLDEDGRELVLALLGELAECGSVVVAAHEAELARQLAPRAVFLRSGVLEAV